jgi:hypothetical protein
MFKFINSFSQLTRRTQKLVVLSAAAVLLLGIVAYASIPDANGIIHGCYKKTSGQLRVIDEQTSACDANETPIQWGQTGPQGPPAPPRLITVATENDTFLQIGCTQTIRSKEFVKQSDTSSLRITYSDTANVTIFTQGGAPSFVVEVRIDGSTASPTPIYSSIVEEGVNAAIIRGFTAFGYANGIPAGTHTLTTHYSRFVFQPSTCYRSNAYTVEIEEIAL